jgi:hypothetical protein
MNAMNDHSDWYRLFAGFWWLLFPLLWACGALFKNILRHNRASDALALLKSYADQGKEPPPELLAVLREPDQAETRKGHGDFATWGWIPVFLFGALAVGFGVMAVTPPDAGVPRVAMIFVALVMTGLCLGNLVAMQSQKKKLPPQ